MLRDCSPFTAEETGRVFAARDEARVIAEGLAKDNKTDELVEMNVKPAAKICEFQITLDKLATAAREHQDQMKDINKLAEVIEESL